MNMFNRILAAALVAFSLVGTALAAELTGEQQAGLEARVASFDTAMRGNNMVEIMGVVPPKVLEAIAARFGVTSEQLVQATQQQFDEAMKSVTLVSFNMDLAKAEIVALPDGTPYALIPTETVMDLGAENGGKLKATSSTLGLLDGETWYLVRIEDAQQVAILKEVYPAFADVTFPTGSMEPVTE